MVRFLINDGEPNSAKFNTILLSFQAAPSTCGNNSQFKIQTTKKKNHIKTTVSDATIVFVVINECNAPERLETSSSSHVDTSSSLQRFEKKK